LKGLTLPTRLRKIRKQRGSRFHGWGQVGQHRSTGSKGGSGKAGLLKHKWTWTVKYDPDHFGVKGFNPPTRRKIDRWINVGQLDSIAPKIAKSNTKVRTINLAERGYDKLLGQGRVKEAYKIIIDNFTQNAKRKIEEVGGIVESR
jgi:large subunit ribosomal protein L15